MSPLYERHKLNNAIKINKRPLGAEKSSRDLFSHRSSRDPPPKRGRSHFFRRYCFFMRLLDLVVFFFFSDSATWMIEQIVSSDTSKSEDLRDRFSA
jgi:hypothetical protein